MLTSALPPPCCASQVNGRYIKKRIHVRIEHVTPSRCHEEFLRRCKENDAARHAAKVCVWVGSGGVAGSFDGTEPTEAGARRSARQAPFVSQCMHCVCGAQLACCRVEDGTLAARPCLTVHPNPCHGPQVEGKPLPALKRQPKGPRTEGIMLKNVKMETITGEAAGGGRRGSGAAGRQEGQEFGACVPISGCVLCGGMDWCFSRTIGCSPSRRFILPVLPPPPQLGPAAVPYDIVREGLL